MRFFDQGPFESLCRPSDIEPIMSNNTIVEKWSHFVYLGNSHIDTPRWSTFPVRIFVTYKIDKLEGQFWERKRTYSERYLEKKNPLRKARHAEIHALNKLNDKIEITNLVKPKAWVMER